jgi:hypothetical protein
MSLPTTWIYLFRRFYILAWSVNCIMSLSSSL